jgi:hypothetical protein
MKKYCDYYITTKRELIGERNNSTPNYGYAWFIRNAKGERLQSSYDNEDAEFHLFDSREVAEQDAREAIQDYY